MGRWVAYHICSRFPNDYDSTQTKWVRVVKRGEKTGNLNILQFLMQSVPDNIERFSFLAPVIESIKQISRYTDATDRAAVINSMFTVFITTEQGDEISEFGGEEDEIDEKLEDEEVTLGSGTVNFLKNGEDVRTVSCYSSDRKL